jgi:hypothetical protein
MFQWEIVAVMRECRRLLVEAYPWLEPYIKISCEKTSGSKDKNLFGPYVDQEPYAHTCTFQGWERVEGQCDFPWARDSNRSFRSEAHEIGGRKRLDVAALYAEAKKIDPWPTRDEYENTPGIQPHDQVREAEPTRRELAEMSQEDIMELGRESLRRHHPSLADELDREEGQ